MRKNLEISLFDAANVMRLRRYSSVKELLQKNIDYVVNAISNQLRYAELNVSALKVLFGILNFSGTKTHLNFIFPLISF